MIPNSLFEDFSVVVKFVARNLIRIFTNFYENPRFSFLFNMALLPVILLFSFDILMSFILSFKSRKLVLFNVLSSRSWSAIRSANNQNRLKVQNYQVRYTSLSKLGNAILKKIRKREVGNNNSDSGINGDSRTIFNPNNPHGYSYADIMRMQRQHQYDSAQNRRRAERESYSKHQNLDITPDEDEI